MQAIQERPAYVTFEVRPVEDREATMRNGHFTAKDVVFALITPQGSKDRIERIAEDWVKLNFTHANEGRMPLEWAQAYDRAFKAYREGREVPEIGIAVVNWPAVGPAEVKALLDANIRTVEDLANANESALTTIGIGGRALKQKAIAWIDSAGSVGKVAFELDALRQKVADIESRNVQLSEVNQKLIAQVEALQPKVEEEA